MDDQYDVRMLKLSAFFLYLYGFGGIPIFRNQLSEFFKSAGNVEMILLAVAMSLLVCMSAFITNKLIEWYLNKDQGNRLKR